MGTAGEAFFLSLLYDDADECCCCCFEYADGNHVDSDIGGFAEVECPEVEEKASRMVESA